MNPTELVVDGVAGYRLTRLVTADTITLPLRGRVIRWAYEREIRKRRLPRRSPVGDRVRQVLEEAPDAWRVWHEMAIDASVPPPALAKLVTCRWCAGMWVGFGVTAARQLAPRLWRPLAYALNVAAAGVLVARLEDPDDDT